MGPAICKNCCAREFIEHDDAYVCAYCDTRYRKASTIAVKEVSFGETSVSEPVNNIAYSKPSDLETTTGRRKNKWVAFLFCLFWGYYGAHKFYEGRIGMGILYFFTAGLFGIGWLVDCFILLFKPNPYYV